MNTMPDNIDNDAPQNPDSMITLSSLTTTAVRKGFSENFSVDKGGKLLKSPSTGNTYHPQDVRIENFYRFEGASDPGDNAILYCLQTNDGTKGMLIDSYGHDADAAISEFIKKVEEIHKTEAEG